MVINPNIDYSDEKSVLKLLMDIDLLVNESYIKKYKVAEEMGMTKYTYSKFISAVDGYVSEDRCRRCCAWINENLD